MTDKTATTPAPDAQPQDEEPKPGRYQVPRFNAWWFDEPIYATSFEALQHYDERLWKHINPW